MSPLSTLENKSKLEKKKKPKIPKAQFLMFHCINLMNMQMHVDILIIIENLKIGLFYKDYKCKQTFNTIKKTNLCGVCCSNPLFKIFVIGTLLFEFCSHTVPLK